MSFSDCKPEIEISVLPLKVQAEKRPICLQKKKKKRQNDPNLKKETVQHKDI